MNFETALKKTALIVLASLLSIPYLIFIFSYIITQQIFHWVVAAFEAQAFLITLHIFLISLIVTILIYSKPDKQLSYRVNSKRDIFLLIFLGGVALSFFQAQYKSAYFDEMDYWIQAIYLYFISPFLINDDTKDKIKGLITAIITTGTITAVVLSVVTICQPLSIYIPCNPLADYLVLPFYLVCYRLYSEQNPGKRIIYWCSLLAILLFIVLSKSRAVWLGLIISFVLLCIFEKNILREFGRVISQHVWDKIIIAVGIVILITLSITYSKNLDWSNLVGLDKALKSFLQFNQGSIYGRFKLWCNSIFILKDHFLLGVGLNNWRMVYPQYNTKLLFDAGFDDRPVNFYLKLAIEIGIPGTVALLAYLMGFFKNKGFKSNLNIFIKCALFSILFVSFFHDLYPYFLPIIFVTLIMLSHLQEHRDIVVLKRNLLLALCIFFNLLFAFQSIIRYKATEFTIIGYFAEQYYLRLPHINNFKDKLLYPLVNQFAGTLQQSKVNDFFLKNTSKPYAGNIYLHLARNESILSKNNDKTFYWINKAAELSPLDYETILFKAGIEYRSQKFFEAQKTCETYINHGYPGLWLHKILGDIDKQSNHENEALSQYQLAKKDFDDQFSSITQASLYKVNNYYLIRNGLINLIDATEKDLHIKSAQNIMEKIESTPQYNEILAYDQKKKEIFFSANLMGGYDLYSFKRKGNLLTQLTKLENYSPFRLRLSTADNRIYFTSDWQGDYYYNIFYWDIKNKILKRITHYNNADAGEYEISPDDKEIAYILKKDNKENLYLIKNNSNKAYQLTTDNHPKDYLCWSPNAKDIAYVCDKNSICLYDLPSNSNKRIVRNTGNLIKMLHFSKDGRRVLFAGEVNEQSGQIYAYDLNTSQVKQLTHGDNLKLFPLDIDESKIIYIRKNMDSYLLNLLDTKTGENVPVGPTQGVVYGPSMVQTPQELLFFFSDKNTPCTVHSLSLRNHTFNRLLKLDTINNDDIIAPQKISIKAIDNYQIPVYYFEPYHYDASKKYPVIIWFHGSHEEFSPRWHVYTQYFAMNGFAVFALNYRQGNVNDIFQVCEYIRQNKLFNATNIYLAGVSSGAMMIEKALKQHPELFKGAVELVGVVNKYFDSPIPKLPPMKIFLGKNDAYVNNDEKIKQISLQRNTGNRIDFVIFEKEGHDFRHQNNVKRTLQETVDFFKNIERGHSGQ